MEVQTINFDRNGLYRSAFKKNQFYVQRHIHQCSEIIYVQKGEVDVIVEDKKKTIKKGEIAVIAPFQVHTVFTPEYVELWLCVFSNELLLDFIPKPELYRGRKFFYFKPSARLCEFLKNKLPNSDEEMVSFNYDDLRRIKIILLSILDEYIQAVPELSDANQNSIISDILLFLDKNHSEDININSVAQALGYTPRHISRILTDLKNYNFRMLLNSFRIEHAKRLIRKTDLKMLDISLESGFSNERSFYRAFQKIEGTTPKEYRKALRR